MLFTLNIIQLIDDSLISTRRKVLISPLMIIYKIFKVQVQTGTNKKLIQSNTMKFVATDGSVFTNRSEYRKYEMETQYTVREK